GSYDELVKEDDCTYFYYSHWVHGSIFGDLKFKLEEANDEISRRADMEMQWYFIKGVDLNKLEIMDLLTKQQYEDFLKEHHYTEQDVPRSLYQEYCDYVVNHPEYRYFINTIKDFDTWRSEQEVSTRLAQQPEQHGR